MLVLLRTYRPQILLQRYRTCTLSRFPIRQPGSSRQRGVRVPLHPSILVPQQEVLWHTSQHLPTDNLEEGLNRLLIDNNALLIERQLEMLTIFVGFEQSNRYSITNEVGELVGYIAEEPKGFFGVVARQAFATHRPFRAVIMDLEGSPVMWIRRPFSWINSRMYVQRLKDFSAYTPGGESVLDTFAEVQQVWHPWRRCYNLFIRKSPKHILSLASEPQPQPEQEIFSQFAKVDSGFLAWHFKVMDNRGEELAYLSRAFRGFGREIFTDTGQYSVRFRPRDADPNGSVNAVTTPTPPKLTLDQRALNPSVTVNIDFDYFSRHSVSGR
ncbi:Scramblase-domain-containing protein [Collybia nuda]|uniref:Phospholipid scramblase n=1 Tax=Collybia nuda TaxID=64659 RepID=A0A9P5XZU2_9AGAR|nr:Scramblase-domain-containing protein [Collybia nuda]